MTQVATKPEQNNVPAQREISHAERFTNMVIKEFSANAGGQIELSPFQKKLCQNYFIRIDLMLKELEQKRLAKREQYRESLAFTWENVNMMKLANDVIIYSGVGLDPTQPNHVNPIPYKNSKTNKYDFTFIVGYRGTELKAKKYGMDIPDDVVVELIYSKDTFRAIKKDMNNPVETYVFEMSSDLDRGEVVGGFYYYKYFSKPEKNKIKTFSKKDIEKRMPDNASAEFWGGEKDKWENGQKVGKEQVEGWYDEMAYKTIYKAAYNGITIDSEKIDSNYVSLIAKESETKDLRLMQEINDNANKKEMSFDASQIPSAEVVKDPQPVINNNTSAPAQKTIDGPGF
jgi:recombination protein RecT